MSCSSMDHLLPQTLPRMEEVYCRDRPRCPEVAIQPEGTIRNLCTLDYEDASLRHDYYIPKRQGQSERRYSLTHARSKR